MSTALSELTTLRLGGPAGRLLEAATDDAVVEAVLAADRAGEPLLVLAGGSNVVVADRGFPGTVVRVATRGVRVEERGGGRVRLDVQAGEPWDRFVAARVEDGLAGVECLSGIPGSVGATPIQNVGAYGQEVAETIVSVRVLDRSRGAVEELPADACGFTYRSSAFRRIPGRWVVLAVRFELDRRERSGSLRYAELADALGVEVGGRAQLPAVREAVLRLRRRKGMVVDPGDPDSVSAGSFFTNPIVDAPGFEALLARVPDGERPSAWPDGDGRVKLSAAWLIEHAGFGRGFGDPTGIAISSKHTLALTNRGAGTTTQLLELAHEIADGVRAAFGVELTPEPVLVGASWREAAASPRS